MKKIDPIELEKIIRVVNTVPKNLYESTKIIDYSKNKNVKRKKKRK